MNTCPDCKCQFVQPFKCITCGAEKLYDATVKSQQACIERLEASLLIARSRINHETGDCCEADKRSMSGGCTNCGTPCL